MGRFCPFLFYQNLVKGKTISRFEVTQPAEPDAAFYIPRSGTGKRFPFFTGCPGVESGCAQSVQIK
jgi:hypothetical protein